MSISPYSHRISPIPMICSELTNPKKKKKYGYGTTSSRTPINIGPRALRLLPLVMAVVFCVCLCGPFLLVQHIADDGRWLAHEEHIKQTNIIQTFSLFIVFFVYRTHKHIRFCHELRFRGMFYAFLIKINIKIEYYIQKAPQIYLQLRIYINSSIRDDWALANDLETRI